MLTYEKAHELFEYRDGQLYRKVRRGPAPAGEVVGSKDTSGRLQVKVDGSMHYVHRVIYLMHHGNCAEYVDHIDGDWLNNRIENLRAATRSQNNHNAKRRTDNTSGVKGVDWHKGAWRVRITVDGKQIHVGYFHDLDEAKQAAENARAQYHGAFAKH